MEWVNLPISKVSCGSSIEFTPKTKENATKFVTKYVFNNKVSSIIPDADNPLHNFKKVNYMSYIQGQSEHHLTIVY